MSLVFLFFFFFFFFFFFLNLKNLVLVENEVLGGSISKFEENLKKVCHVGKHSVK